MASTNDYAVDVMNDNAVDQAVDEARKKNRKKNRIIEVTLYSLSFIFFFISILKYPFSGKVMLEEEEKRVKTATTFRDAARVGIVQADQRNASILRDYKENKNTLGTIQDQVASVVAELEKISSTAGEKSEEMTRSDVLLSLSRQSFMLRGLFIREQESKKREAGIPRMSVLDILDKNKLVVFSLLGDDNVYQNGFAYSCHWISANPSFQPKAMLRHIKTPNDYALVLDTPYPTAVVRTPQVSCFTSRIISSVSSVDNVLLVGIPRSQTDNNITQGMTLYCLHYAISNDGTDDLKISRGFISGNYETDGQIYYSASVAFDSSMRGAPVFNDDDRLIGMIVNASIKDEGQIAFIPINSIIFK